VLRRAAWAALIIIALVCLGQTGKPSFGRDGRDIAHFGLTLKTESVLKFFESTATAIHVSVAPTLHSKIAGSLFIKNVGIRNSDCYLDGEKVVVFDLPGEEGLEISDGVMPRCGLAYIKATEPDGRREVDSSLTGLNNYFDVGINITRPRLSGISEIQVDGNCPVLSYSYRGFWLIRNDQRSIYLIPGSRIGGAGSISSHLCSIRRIFERPIGPLHLIQLALDSQEGTKSDNSANHTDEYKRLGVSSYSPSPKDHIGVKFALLVLLIFIGYRAIWFAVETDETLHHPMKKWTAWLAVLIALLAICGAGKLLVDII
jgi:hypothetical protein